MFKPLTESNAGGLMSWFRGWMNVVLSVSVAASNCMNSCHDFVSFEAEAAGNGRHPHCLAKCAD